MRVPTVLLIDDDANTLIALTAILDGRGLRILDAVDDQGATQWCHTAGEIDVLVADVVLQNTNGPDLVRALRRIQPRARALFISGYSLKELTKRGLLSQADLAAGTVEFLQKPFDAKIFADAVNQLVSSDSAPRVERRNA